MIKHLNIKIFGSVQNVGFRYTSQRLADKLGLKGFVRNEQDGSLYVEVEGENQSVQEFENWCKQGPRWAEVTNVEITAGEMKNFDDFQILH